MANNNIANIPVWVLPLLLIVGAIVAMLLVGSGMGSKLPFNPFNTKRSRKRGRSGYCSRCGMFGGACKCPKGKCACGK